MESFLSSIKKEVQKAKNSENVDEKDSDPLPIGLYKKKNMWMGSWRGEHFCMELESHAVEFDGSTF